MMDRRPTLVTFVGLLCLVLSAPVNVRSFCLLEPDEREYGSPQGDPANLIPVFIDKGPGGDVRRTGLSLTAIRNYTLAALAEINAATASVPRLFFGGFTETTSESTNPQTLFGLGELTPGITVRAATCERSIDVDAQAMQGDFFNPVLGRNFSTVTFRPRQNDSGVRCDTILGSGSKLWEAWNTVGSGYARPGGITDFELLFDCITPGVGVFQAGDGDTPARCVEYKDFQGVLVHELLHALGLDHHEIGRQTCEGGGGTFGGVPYDVGEPPAAFLGGAYGVVRTDRLVSLGAARHLFQEDIQGLEAIYGPSARFLHRWEGTFNETVTFGMRLDDVAVPELLTKTPVAVTGVVDPADPFLAIAFADTQNFVRAYVRDNDWHPLGPNDGIVDPVNELVASGVPPEVSLGDSGGGGVIAPVPVFVPAGQTFQRPAIAYGPPSSAGGVGRVMVAWVAEHPGQKFAQLRWAIINADGSGGWTYGGLPDDEIRIRHRFSGGLGYDPIDNLFLLMHLDSMIEESYPDQVRQVPWLVRVDPQTADPRAPKRMDNPVPEPPAVVQAPFWAWPAEPLHDLGKPACGRFEALYGLFRSPPARSQCLVPVATSGPNGPCMGWYSIEPGVGGPNAYRRTISCLNILGLGDFTGDPTGEEGFVGTFTSFLPPPALPLRTPSAFIFGVYGLRGVPRTPGLTVGAGGGSIGGFTLPGFNPAPSDEGIIPNLPPALRLVPEFMILPFEYPWWPSSIGSHGSDNGVRYSLFREGIECPGGACGDVITQ